MATKKNLVIVESPAKAKTIGKYLGPDYVVKASMGHLRDLPKSTLGVDVDDDFTPNYRPIKGKEDIIKDLKTAAKNSKAVFLATDPDREGEAISWHLQHLLDLPDDKARRVTFNEITKKVVTDSIQHPRAIDQDLVDAQQARRVLDRIVGYQLSPLLWKKIRRNLSAGRVQSVAIRLVAQREKEIADFVPQEYWTLDAALQNKDGAPFTAHYYGVDGKKYEPKDEADAQRIVAELQKETFTVKTVKRTDKQRSPTPPFTTSSLQQEAGRKLNFTTQKTMQVVQQLYEGIELEKEGMQGLVTYIRTDSVTVSQEALNAVRGYIAAQYGKEYLPAEPIIYKGRSNAQNAHEAIRPTDVNRTPDSIKQSLTKEQFQLYRLIYSRFVSSQMNPAVYDTLSMDINGDGVGLRFYGEHKRFSGFSAIYEESVDDAGEAAETVIPQMKEGDPVIIQSVDSEQHFTQPPARFTEASLVRMMDEKGIGRPSTYAPTITTIIARGYVTRESKRLFPTELGRMVNSVMTQYFAPIVDLEFTAQMEEKLDSIEAGKLEWKQMLREFYPPFEKMLEEAEQAIEKVELRDEPSDEICDKCGANMVYRVGRYGKFLACPNFPDCRNTKPVLNYIDAKCPKCGGRLLEKTSRKNRKFYGCEHYPECDFVSWEMPVDERCPKCGSYMILKRSRKGETCYLCANEACRHRVEVKQEDTEE